MKTFEEFAEGCPAHYVRWTCTGAKKYQVCRLNEDDCCEDDCAVYYAYRMCCEQAEVGYNLPENQTTTQILTFDPPKMDEIIARVNQAAGFGDKVKGVKDEGEN